MYRPRASQSLFVRVPVGGDQERVEIHLIAHPDDDQTEARRLLTEQFATFDAGKAQCFLASDREHLLAVIEAGFGDFYDFNRVARNLLTKRCVISSPSRQSTTLQRWTRQSTFEVALQKCSACVPWMGTLAAQRYFPRHHLE